MKKSQVTIFIVIAIIFVALILIFVVVESRVINLGGGNIEPNVKPIYSYIESCIKETGENAIEHIGKTGGYSKVPEPSLSKSIAYYFISEENHMPSKERVEKEISIYVNEMLFFCTKNFIDFPAYEFTQEDVSTKTKIMKNKVIFDVSYPLSITRGDKTYTFKDFKRIEIPSRLDIIYATAHNITKEQLKNPKSICLTCINALMYKNDLYIELNDYDKETVIFSIIDKNYKINDKDYVFNFVNKYEKIS